MASYATGSAYDGTLIRKLREAMDMERAGVPADQMNPKPPKVENAPPFPPRPAWLGGGQEPQQIFPAPADFPKEPPPKLKSVLKKP